VVTIRFEGKRNAINRDGGIAANAQIQCNGEINSMNVDRRMRIESIWQGCGDDIDGGLNKYRGHCWPEVAGCASNARAS
jgi:hypothetical protein